MDEDQTQTTLTPDRAHLAINYVFNIISIFLAAFLLIIIIALKVKEINFSNRISINIIMYVSIIEIFFSVFQILRLTPNLPIWMSYIASWGYIFTTLLICFLVFTILINIQLIFIHHYKDKLRIGRYYLLIPIVLSVILSGIPIINRGLIFDKEQNYYWYSTPILELLLYQGWMAFIISYSMISLFFIRSHLGENSQMLTDSNSISDTSDTSDTTTMVPPHIPYSKPFLKHVSRITFYSLIPILSYSPTMLTYLVHSITNENYSVLDLFSLILISSQSIFTFVIFLFDPIIDEAILEHEKNLKLKQTIENKVKQGVYVNNIYNISQELPSNKEDHNKEGNNNDNEDHNNEGNNKGDNNKEDQNQKKRQNKHRSSIYVYTKNRISGLTSVINNRKISMEVKKELFNFNLESEDDILCSL